MRQARRPPGALPLSALLPLAALGAALLRCSSGSPSARSSDTLGDGGGCFADSDGLTGGSYTINLTVDDTAFSRTVISTQNDATVTLTLTNKGTMPHGFAVGCVSVTSAFPNLPAGCSTMSCFPPGSIIAPLAPGASQTVTFFTPTADNLLYPFTDGLPNDAMPSGLSGQWNLM